MDKIVGTLRKEGFGNGFPESNQLPEPALGVGIELDDDPFKS
jgi:hypothetical protein